MKFLINGGLCCLAFILFTSCASTDTAATIPEGEKLSSLPHNMPASWEGQGGMGGAFNQQ